jgi:hypothetical protein
MDETEADLKDERERKISRIVRDEFAHDIIALRTLIRMLDEEIGARPANSRIAAQLLTAHHLATMNVGLRQLQEVLNRHNAVSDIAEKMWDA